MSQAWQNLEEEEEETEEEEEERRKRGMPNEGRLGLPRTGWKILL
jgi:hypothetical protein